MIKVKIFILVFTMLVVLTVAPGFGYASNVLSLEPLDLFNRAFSETSKSTTTSLPALPGFKLPPELQKSVKGFLSGTSTGTGSNFDFKQLLNTESLSGKDFGSALKAIAVLAINLFLIIIQTVAAILKALLPFLQ